MAMFTLWSCYAAVFLLFGAQVRAAVTGQQYCNQYMCITGRHDSEKNLDTYTLAPPLGSLIPQKSFGWIAIGFGTTMTNTPMVIAWPNADGSITLSQRQASGHIMPRVIPDPPRKATLLTGSSFTNTTTTSISFTIPSSTNVSSTLNQTALIWAYSTVNPGTASGNANIQQHLASGNTRLSLAAALPDSLGTPTVTGGSPTPSGTRPASTTGTTGSGNGTIIDDGTSPTVNKKVLVAHVVCGALATMAILPIGILVPRIARGLTMSRWWFPVHGALNGLIAFALIVAAFAIARHNFHHGGFYSTHRKLGLTLFILAIFQTLLGLFTHFYQRTHRLQTSAGRGPTNFLHMLLGLVVVGIGFGTVWAGIDEEWGRYSGTGNPNVGWKVGWGLIVGITALGYIGGLYFVPRQLQNEARRRQWAASVGRGAYPSTTPTKANGTEMVSAPPPPPPPPQHAEALARSHSQRHHHHSTGGGVPSVSPVLPVSPVNPVAPGAVSQPPRTKRRLPPPLDPR